MFEDLKPNEITDIKNLMKATADTDESKGFIAQQAFAAAIQTPLREGILVGDILSGIFTETVLDPGALPTYPIDFYRPDNANEYTAYVIPNQGKIPQRQIEGDYVNVPTYDIGAGIDWLLRFSKEARYDVVGRALQVLEAGFVKKRNDDGFHTLLAAGFDRNIVVSDSNAAAGQFTKRLVSLMKLVMRRNGGGNSASLRRSRLTHLFVSPEALEDMRNWGIDQVDEVTRREIYQSNEEGATQIYDVKIVALDELGEGQEYQTWYNTYATAQGASNNGMAAGDLELVLGLDATQNDSFVSPIRDPLQIFPDPTLHRERRQGYYAWQSLGFAVLDTSKVLLGSF